MESGNDVNLVFQNHPEVGVSGRSLLDNHLDDGSGGRLSSTNLAGCSVSTGLCLQHEGVTGEELSKRMIDLKGTLSSVKPEMGGVAGTKRKFETAVMDSEDGITSSGESKKYQKVWNCALCQVSVKSDRSFEDHLKGKKHKAKEKAMAITTKTMEDNCDLKPGEAGSSITLPTPSDTIRSKIVAKSQGLEHQEKGHEAINMNTKNESDNFKFWCKMCSVGTNSESLMTAHRRGDEHNSLLQQKGGSLVAVRNMLI